MAFLARMGRSIVKNASRSTLRTTGKALAPAIFITQSREMATSKFFVGGLAWATDEQALRDAFSSFGTVTDVRIITDVIIPHSGRSRGFGFVSYNSEEEAQTAQEEMDGRDLAGRVIRVAYAKDRGSSGGGFAARGPPGITIVISRSHVQFY